MAKAMAAGLIQALPVDTRPGENHVFSPPAGFSGSDKDYRALIRDRWDNHVGANQQISFVVKVMNDRTSEPVIQGPYAGPAKEILRFLARSGLAHGKRSGE